MENLTPYCYKADDTESYNTLAAYVVTSPLNATFFPKLLTIVVTPKKDEETAFIGVGKFIDTEGLDFHINPIILHDECRGDLIDNEITPSCLLQTIIYQTLADNAHQTEIAKSLQTRLDVCESNLSKAQKDRDQYYKWWQEEESKRRLLNESIKALRTLLNAVVE